MHLGFGLLALFIRMKVEIKIEYNPGKFVKLYREVDSQTYKFQNLIADIRASCPGFAELTAQTIRVRFEDEDGDFINLTEDDSQDVEEMLM